MKIHVDPDPNISLEQYAKFFISVRLPKLEKTSNFGLVIFKKAFFHKFQKIIYL